MNEIILQIKKEMEKQSLTTPKMLERIGEANEKEIRKTNRCLAGKTTRLDAGWVYKINKALGIVAEGDTNYSVTTVHRTITPEEEEILRVTKDMPLVRAALLEMATMTEDMQFEHYKKIKEDARRRGQGGGDPAPDQE